MKITAVIVIFNNDISQSVTCKRINANNNIALLIVDNSTIENKNENYCRINGIDYISMGGNKGLSKAYNTAIDQICNTTDVIVLLDDDTEVPDEYFNLLLKEDSEKEDIDIFAPIIKGKDGVIYSPNNYNFLKNRLVASRTDEVKQESFNAISSCLAIRSRVFENYRYNEKLFVDEIDHCFFREQRKLNRKFGVLKIEIIQNFHQRENDIAPDNAWKRLRIRILDIFGHARLMGGRKYTILAFVKCCGLGLQLGKKSGSITVALKSGLLSFKLLFVEE